MEAAVPWEVPYSDGMVHRGRTVPKQVAAMVTAAKVEGHQQRRRHQFLGSQPSYEGRKHGTRGRVGTREKAVSEREAQARQAQSTQQADSRGLSLYPCCRARVCCRESFENNHRQNMPTLAKGAAAPDFQATTHTGDACSLATLTSETASVLLWFYPRASTGGW